MNVDVTDERKSGTTTLLIDGGLQIEEVGEEQFLGEGSREEKWSESKKLPRREKGDPCLLALPSPTRT